jgi:DNA modification methylase
MVKNQVITEDYAIYCSDCMFVLPTIANDSVDLAVYSPPFAGLYNYSSHENDFSNCESREQFLQQYEFLIAEMARVTKPGCINAVHVTDIIGQDGDLWDFPCHVKALHKKYGFKHRATITISKEPLEVRRRTMVRSLMHKMIVEDCTEAYPTMPDYLLVFQKRGKRHTPVTHPFGFTHYAGAEPLLPHMVKALKGQIPNLVADGVSMDEIDEQLAVFEALKKRYKGYDGDQIANRLSHNIWRRYADSVWQDIRIDNVLPFQDAKEDDDEKHVHPLQLDVIDRVVELWSNPGEVVLTPFMGVGSEVYSPVSIGRRAIGIELKESYFKQAIVNMREAKSRFDKPMQAEIDFGEEKTEWLPIDEEMSK